MPTPIIVRFRLIRGGTGGALTGGIGGAVTAAGARTAAGTGAAATGGAGETGGMTEETGEGAIAAPGAVPPRAGPICVVSDASGGTGNGTGALRSATSRR